LSGFFVSVICENGDFMLQSGSEGMRMSFRALIVDDSTMMRQLMILALAPITGLVCDQAGDGIQAIKRLVCEPYDILITDVNMPQIGGIKLVEMIRKDLQYSDLPVIVVSTEGTEDVRRAAQEAGADAYLTKPLQPTQLIAMVRKLLDQEGRATGGAT
jgi:two-component system chemotaxis response regulator CheY